MTQQKAPVATASQVMAGAGKTFYQAAGLLPASVRAEVIALYAFCRKVDDLADESDLPVPVRRAKLLAIADAFEHGREAEMRDAGWPFECTGRRPRTASLLIRAALGDVTQRQPENDAELLAYAFGVAGTVGILMAEGLQARPEGYAAAVALGLAMQLTNICRDVAEDAREGRIYLPAKRVSAMQLQRTLGGECQDAARRVRQATLHLLYLADELYRVALNGLWSLPWRARWSILAAALCYREIGVVVGRDVERSWRRRAVVGRLRKIQLIVWAGFRLLMPRMWRQRSPAAWPAVLGATALEQGHRLGLAS